MTYQWPGNVRELERVIERAVTLAETSSIELDDLPPQVRGEFAQILWPSLERGESLRHWGARYAKLVFTVRSQQTQRLPGSGHQLSHTSWLPAA